VRKLLKSAPVQKIAKNKAAQRKVSAALFESGARRTELHDFLLYSLSRRYARPEYQLTQHDIDRIGNRQVMSIIRDYKPLVYNESTAPAIVAIVFAVLLYKFIHNMGQMGGEFFGEGSLESTPRTNLSS